jgi:DNA-binding NtrC family response regulator
MKEKTRKILIVDDEPKFNRQMKTFFLRLGFTVDTAATGSLALEIARRNPPEVLIIDWVLKDTLNGLDVVLQLKENNPDLAAVLISGYPSPEMEKRARELGKVTFISKPFDAGQILSAVQRAAGGDDL